MQVQSQTVAVQCDGSGAATVFSPVITGRITSIAYIPGSTPLGGTTSTTITAEATGQNIWTQTINGASAIYKAPRQPLNDQAGAALLYAAGGTPQSDYISIANDRIKIVLTGAGANANGSFIFTVN